MGQGRHVAEHASEAMVEGHWQADAIELGVAQNVANEQAVVQDVVMRERCALWDASRPGCVLDVDGIIELNAGLADLQLVVGYLFRVS
jgi:hypothetical protein